MNHLLHKTSSRCRAVVMHHSYQLVSILYINITLHTNVTSQIIPGIVLQFRSHRSINLLLPKSEGDTAVALVVLTLGKPRAALPNHSACPVIKYSRRCIQALHLHIKELQQSLAIIWSWFGRVKVHLHTTLVKASGKRSQTKLAPWVRVSVSLRHCRSFWSTTPAFCYDK